MRMRRHATSISRTGHTALYILSGGMDVTADRTNRFRPTGGDMRAISMLSISIMP